ncbi:unnamed protein product [Linum trigynum]|uniref:Uncharacterized protein n=1 Tax=Linum trigynum TaxID=586398 RepID=A0AAV2CKC2_9ROSI
MLSFLTEALVFIAVVVLRDRIPSGHHRGGRGTFACSLQYLGRGRDGGAAVVVLFSVGLDETPLPLLLGTSGPGMLLLGEGMIGGLGQTGTTARLAHYFLKVDWRGKRWWII